MRETTITIKSQPLQITDEDIKRVARDFSPERITRYYVEVEGKCFPPKQLIRLVTRTRDSFNSANARSALTRLGFSVRSK